ncbi:hypothetical protein GLOIN_2v1578121 [Rhizophagus irregularis DAOM 181602=DAOM 197198]|uniref:RNA-dependent RNA polymerase n=2 Tax=Rhizophagus irregularis (strain DAOM 181602 / DAOM 197198 / MUCL 43194) TaxID=747089 RepID=A0A2P4Q948_RHIID|nr:hypothetical protein GLOIN_2v1578121 [Rhizophagus irregularis DAOM 181602=DAOM 197198]POG74151.1 hypothetical protein GLOIN_2v1578121 [Rhizophagus irregularis DAOM 181602=DAOM 197198]CAG8617752.1 9606_t:CDS:2 [Rhizophagus irregularis]|eukprot:XP_025181017.1 hypothetical protein GLOIN_2v1578121 [Rhizophagus irregularis DAOM 181602=DAOM 197198]
MTFKVSNVHPKAEVLELKEHFESYGSVYRVQIETKDFESGERPTGVVYITFKPVPKYPFWKSTVSFHGKHLKVDYQQKDDNSLDMFIDQTDARQRLKFHSFQAESLEMGVYLQPDTFVSEIKYTDSVKFTIDYQKRSISVEFGFRSDQSAQQIHMFKLEIDFKNIEDEIHVELDAPQRSRGSITIANKYPAKYWVLDSRLQPKDKFNWCLDDSWKRKTEIRILPKRKEEKEIPLQPHMPDNSEQLGKWVVYRITFDLDRLGSTSAEGLHRFKKMIEEAGEFNLVKFSNINYRSLNIICGTNLRKYVERSMLDFDVLYMTECNISFNYLHDYNLNEDFFFSLARLPTQSAIYILETIFAGKKRIYDPLSYLRLEVMKLDVEEKSNHVPSDCVMIRKVVITPTTMYILMPTMETSNRVIRHFRDKKDNFLRVQFIDEASSKICSSNGTHNYALYNKIYNTLHNGIKIGDRQYEFLTFSSSQLKEHSCWFFASTYDLTAGDIRSWMGDFSINKSVAKYAVRMGQCLSSTRVVLPVNNDIRVIVIPDVVRNRYTFSDGIGNISVSLAKKAAEKLELKNIPSAFQFRLAGYKGILCQSRFLRDNQIQVRHSQCKFESKHLELEFIRGSTFIPAYLNHHAITLLSSLGVPDSVFIEMKDAQVSDLNRIFMNETTAINVLHQNIDEHGISKSLADLVKVGFLQKRDKYLMNLLSLFRIMMLRDLKKKAKIRVDEGAFLLGVLDETETLREDQVYCCVSDQYNPSNRRVITGTCIVYRNPCFHPGDIRVVTAVNCKKLDHLVDVIVFPAIGYRDIPSQCSGGDLDGDNFTIIYDERLIPQKKNLGPMNYEAQNPEMVENVTMDHVKKFFVNYMLSDEIDMIANAHMAKADTSDVGAFHGQCIRLAQLHSEAVDYPKTGRPAIFPPELRAHKFPDFMEITDKATYQSEKVLGRLYRSIEVDEFVLCDNFEFDNRLYVEGYQAYLEDARILKSAYDADIRGLMNQFGIATEFEVTSGYIVNTITNVDRKKPHNITKSIMDAVIPIKRHYRKLFEGEFYGEGTRVVSPGARNRMEAKACAWYYVTYHPSELGDDPSENMISFPWIIYEFLCEIAIRNNNKANTIRDYHKQSGPIGASKYHQKAIQPEDDIRSKQEMFNNGNLDYTKYNRHLLDNNNDDEMSKLGKNISTQYKNRNPDYISYNQYPFIDENDDDMDILKQKIFMQNKHINHYRH